MSVSSDVRFQGGDHHESPSLVVNPTRGRSLVKNTVATETADGVDTNQRGWDGHSSTIYVID